MKKLVLLAILAVVAGCGTVTTTAIETAVRPTIVPGQAVVASSPAVEQEAKVFPTAVVAKKYQTCTSALGPKANTVQTNQAFRDLPREAQRFLTNGMMGNSTISPPMDMRSACGGEACLPNLQRNTVNMPGPKLQK